MDDGWNQVRRGRRKVQEQVFPEERRSLSSLLTQEYYLTKIFMHLLEDGLQECRLVCRRWCEVGNRLVTKSPWTCPTELSDIVKKFPNIDSLHTDSELDDRWDPKDKAQKQCSVEDVFTRLAAFKSLKHLKLNARFPHLAYDFPELQTERQSYFHRLGALTSLHLTVEYMERSSVFCSSLSSLTMLTSLDFSPYFGDRLDVRAFTGLSRLQTLCVGHGGLFNKDRKLLFPSLPHLTHLKCSDERCVMSGARSTETLEVVMRCALSLKSLHLLLYAAPDDTNWVHLARMRKLCRLRLDFEEHVGFYPFLKKMWNLKELALMGEIDFRSRTVKEGIFSIATLESLQLESITESEEQNMDGFSRLTNLTQLVAADGNFGSSLSCLTELRCLDIHTAWRRSTDIVRTLTCLTNLEWLCLRHWEHERKLGIPGRTFGRLTKLKCLRLTDLDVDGDFIKSLRSATGLTQLYFSTDPHRTQPYSFFSGIEHLNELHNLTMHCGYGCNPLHFLNAGCFPHLRNLAVHSCWNGETERLKRRFPSLLSVNEGRGWCHWRCLHD